MFKLNFSIDIKKNVLNGLLSFVVMSVLLLSSGCGSSDGNSDKSKQGYLIDSGIVGLNYESQPSGKKGITGKKGTYGFNDGDTVTFTLGGVQIGASVKAKKEPITPIALYGLTEDNYENNDEVVNFLRFIQTSDNDGNLENGIQIDKKIKDIFKNKTTFNFKEESNVQIVLAASGINRILVDKKEAIRHMNNSLSDVYINIFDKDDKKSRAFRAYYGGYFELQRNAINKIGDSRLETIKYTTQALQATADLTEIVLDKNNDSDKKIIIKVSNLLIKLLANENENGLTSASVAAVLDLTTTLLLKETPTDTVITTAFNVLGFTQALTSKTEIKNHITIIQYQLRTLLAIVKQDTFALGKLIADGAIINASALAEIISTDSSTQDIGTSIVAQEYLRLYYANGENETSMITFINNKVSLQTPLSYDADTKQIIKIIASLSRLETYPVWKKIGVYLTTSERSYADQYDVSDTIGAINKFKEKFSKYYEALENTTKLATGNERPTKPINIISSDIKENSITLSWTKSNDIDGNIVAYYISYKLPSGSYGNEQSTTSTSVTISNLIPNTNYIFQIRAKDNEGAYSDYGNTNCLPGQTCQALTTSKVPTVTTVDIVGTWLDSMCRDYGNIGYAKGKTIFTNNTATTTHYIYDNPNCIGNYINEINRGSLLYTVGNSNKFTNGKISTELDFGSSSHRRYGMYRIDNNKLFLSMNNGSSNDGSTPSKRLNIEDPNYSIKQ